MMILIFLMQSLLKMGFLSSILEVILSVMVSCHEEEEDEADVLLDGHSQSPQCEASRVSLLIVY